ncbi:MAG: tRNA (adenosine(37)-N6)-threonylcarbamoyltransferase complex transferase subunit TsaD [Betaproteobacteria bacterium]|nr:tRNA (adenosine(37)-N6)-threonylcarbamoyltransferase complex transferase subunit TsaD [Betaproteobacteria bacterium]
MILGIESSCDETGVALYGVHQGLIGHQLHTQVDMHRAYGGVVPELASRDHIRRIVVLTENLLAECGHSLDSIDAIAVTAGPGLGGALLTGTSMAAGLGLALDVPVWPIHHLDGHLLSPLMGADTPEMPFVALLVSGGHTQLMAVRGVGHYELLGETLDDAAGEAFDKTASLLGLGYPGGAALSQLARTGNPMRFTLPRPMIRSGDLEFSFSGLKTAVLTEVRALEAAGQFDAAVRADLAASFEAAVIDVLSAKCGAALRKTGMRALVVAGGVGANVRLRAVLERSMRALGARVHFPPQALCTDNGAMIAHAAALAYQAGLLDRSSRSDSFGVRPRWPLAGSRTTT